jgi:hypothetical protein
VIGVGVGVGINAGHASFSPYDLFGGGLAGAWYDPSDLSSMWQESTAATPAVVNSPVGKILDKSGNGNHAVEVGVATTTRPILRLGAEGYYLEFDGVNDMLRATFTISQTIVRVSAVRMIAWASGRRIFDTGTGTASCTLYETGTTPTLQLYSGTTGLNSTGLAVGTDGVVTERHSGATSRIAINNGSYTTGSAGTTAPNGITLGAGVGANYGNTRLYNVAMINSDLSDAKIASLRTFIGGKAGLVL